jgi:hypothetical protein
MCCAMFCVPSVRSVHGKEIGGSILVICIHATLRNEERARGVSIQRMHADPICQTRWRREYGRCLVYFWCIYTQKYLLQVSCHLIAPLAACQPDEADEHNQPGVEEIVVETAFAPRWHARA